MALFKASKLNKVKEYDLHGDSLGCNDTFVRKTKPVRDSTRVGLGSRLSSKARAGLEVGLAPNMVREYPSLPMSISLKSLRDFL